MKNQQQPPYKKKPYSNYLRFSGIGLQMVGIVVVGVVIGYQIDKHFVNNGTTWYTLGFTVAFIVISMVWSVRQIIQDE